MFATEAACSPINAMGKGPSDPPRYRIAETNLGIWRVSSQGYTKEPTASFSDADATRLLTGAN